MALKNWKILSQKYIHKDRWFIARADECLLPDGRIMEPYYVLETPPWCAIFLVTENEELIVVKQYRHAIQKVTLELPGGIVDANENPMDAVIRETLEETGYKPKHVEFLSALAPNPALHQNMAYFYLGTGAQYLGAKNQDEFEDIEVVKLSKSEVVYFIQQDGFLHSVHVGPMYKAMIKLGWL